jgi:hypothetical protein
MSTGKLVAMRNDYPGLIPVNFMSDKGFEQMYDEYFSYAYYFDLG